MLQRVKIEVDERGTKGASATGRLLTEHFIPQTLNMKTGHLTSKNKNKN